MSSANCDRECANREFVVAQNVLLVNERAANRAVHLPPIDSGFAFCNCPRRNLAMQLR